MRPLSPPALCPSDIVQVAVPSPVRRVFDYWLPPEISSRAALPGTRVRVPFGRGIRIGVIVSRGKPASVSPDRLKAVLGLIDEEPAVPRDLLDLLVWASDYYHHPVGDVFHTALPAPLRRGGPVHERRPRRWRCTAEGLSLDLNSVTGAPRQAKVLALLRSAGGPVAEPELRGLGRWREALRRLVARGWVEEADPCAARALETAAEEPAGPQLTPSQDRAACEVVQGLGNFGVYLLDGVTGSGKTEVYLSVIGAVAGAGGQCLILVPEIGLTPQTVERFERGLAVPIGVLHSGMVDGERLAVWRRARSGEIKVVIGTRSAVFVPLSRPVLFVVDEEHDLSFKQQDGFRYSARDLAVVRARRANVPVILGSATPSLESLRNAATGRYRALQLDQRAGGAALPELRIIDVRNRSYQDGLSSELRAAIRGRMERGEQALLFVNRRGFAPILMCHACGWNAQCTRCDANLVLHAGAHRLRCHHCGAERPVPHVCPSCASAELLPLGSGTERITETLAAAFPSARVARVDRDSTRARGAMGAILDAIHAGEVDIIVGTQMVAKGHHFPRVTLVGILDADGGLFGSDFRASERMAQLVTQVAGRAGRGTVGGEVLVQTHHPNHPLLRTLVQTGYRAFARSALAERDLAELPPFSALALLRAEAPSRGPVFEFLEQARDLVQARRSGAERRAAGEEPMVFGPVPAVMERRSGRFRAQLLVQASSRETLHRSLTPWLETLAALSSGRRVRWSIDIDPQDMT